MFVPKVLHPEPDPHFVSELHKIDPDLRVVWAYDRYFKSCWVIERKIPDERYHAMYYGILESGGATVVTQPIFNEDEEKVGERQFDLAPREEWVMFIVNKDDSFRELDARTLTELRRVYAWERGHSLTRLRIEKQNEHEAAEAKRKAKRLDVAMDALPEVWRAAGKVVFGGQPEKVLAGTAVYEGE